MREPPFAEGFGGRGQEQFLQVLDHDEAERRSRAAVDPAPRGIEQVMLDCTATAARERPPAGLGCRRNPFRST